MDRMDLHLDNTQQEDNQEVRKLEEEEDDDSSSTSSEETCESDSTNLPESLVKASWRKQFQFSNDFHYWPEYTTKCAADEMDLWEQLVIKEAEFSAAQLNVLESDERQEREDKDSTVSSGVDENPDHPPTFNPPPISPTKSISEDEDERVESSEKCNVLEAGESWDHGLHALDPTYKSRSVWMEGQVYQRLFEGCAHEVRRVPCACHQQKKIALCRLCPAVFCSKQCFQKPRKIKSREEFEGGNCVVDASAGNKGDEQVESAEWTSPQPVKTSPKADEECAKIGEVEREPFINPASEIKLVSILKNKAAFENSGSSAVSTDGDANNPCRLSTRNLNVLLGTRTVDPGAGSKPKLTAARTSAGMFIPSQVLKNKALYSNTPAHN